MKLHGEQYAVQNGEFYLDYYYDWTNEKFLDTLSDHAGITQEEMEDIFIFSAILDSDGHASRIMLLDRRMATFFQ